MRPMLVMGGMVVLLISCQRNSRAEWIAACDQDLWRVTTRIAQGAVSVRLLPNSGKGSKTKGETSFSTHELLNCQAILFDPAHDTPAIALWRERLGIQGVFIAEMEPAAKSEKRVRSIQVCAALSRHFPQYAGIFHANLRRELSRLLPTHEVRPVLSWSYRDVLAPLKNYTFSLIRGIEIYDRSKLHSKAAGDSPVWISGGRQDDALESCPAKPRRT